MKNFLKLLTLAFLIVTPAFAADPPSEELVMVPQRYVSADGQAKIQRISVDQFMGQQISKVVNDALAGVSDASARNPDANVAKITMYLVAWRILSGEALGVVLGVPIYFLGLYIWYLVVLRVYFGNWISMLTPEGKKQRVHEPPLQFNSNDAKVMCTIMMVISLTAWSVVMLNIIF